MLESAIYPGTFDPITNGHIDIISRATRMFKSVTLAIAANSRKETMFSLEERVLLARESTSFLKNVNVLGFEDLTVSLVKRKNTAFLIRSIRGISDFDREIQLTYANQHFVKHLETIFLAPSKKWFFVSSSLVKEIMLHKGDASGFIPEEVQKAFLKKC